MSEVPAIERPEAKIVRRILVASDFSGAAHLAVCRAGQLAKQNDAYLHLIHARPDWNLFSGSSPAAADHYRAVTEHAEQALTDELAFLEKTFGIHARGETRIGRASRVLRSAVADIEPHLIVAGARGEHDSRTMAPFLGGTALKLIAFAGSPVLIVRKPGLGPYTVALAAVECSGDAARRVVLWATSLLREGDCHVVHAYDVPYLERVRKRGVSEVAIRSRMDEVRNMAQGFLDEVLYEAAASGQRLHAHLVCGEPVSAVLAEIDRYRPDLIIVGKHEHPQREQFTATLGSVAVRIAYHAPGDVLVVP
jgi:nucleotide-binding universal stress UspA family protein